MLGGSGIRLMQIRDRTTVAPSVGAMPMFYFHLYNDMNVPDEEGVELADLDAARAHAVRQVRVTFAETAKDHGRVVLHHRIDIEDGQGAVVDTVYFRDAVKVEE